MCGRSCPSASAQRGRANALRAIETTQGTLRNVFLDEVPLDQVTYSTTVEDLDIVPSDLTLSQVEYARPVGAETGLARALTRAHAYDVTYAAELEQVRARRDPRAGGAAGRGARGVARRAVRPARARKGAPLSPAAQHTKGNIQ